MSRSTRAGRRNRADSHRLSVYFKSKVIWIPVIPIQLPSPSCCMAIGLSAYCTSECCAYTVVEHFLCHDKFLLLVSLSWPLV
jgi:hypothetical protein